MIFADLIGFDVISPKLATVGDFTGRSFSMAGSSLVLRPAGRPAAARRR